MRVYACLIGFLATIPLSSSVVSASGLSAAATIRATAQVVPPVGVEAYSEVDRPGAPPDDSQLFWIHAPRPGAVYVTVTDISGRAVCLPSFDSFSTLDQHRYRSLICLAGDSIVLAAQPVTLTVIYSAD